jgi:hypothetical protein
MWMLKRNNKLWLMQSETDKHIDSVKLDIDSISQLVELNKKVTSFLNQANNLVVSAGVNPEAYQPEPIKPPGRGKNPKPIVLTRPTPNKSSRNGERIRGIVMHCTTTRSDESTINWFADPKSQVSAHYLVSRSGVIYQFVKDNEKAWHAQSANSSTIGIEHAAEPGDSLTYAQEQASASLVRFLVNEYDISLDNIKGHKDVNKGTSCPNNLWLTPDDLTKWVSQKIGGTAPETTAELFSTGTYYKDGAWTGLLHLQLKIGTETFNVASGAKNCQVLRKPSDPRSTAGNREPIPQGTYTIGDIEWVNGRDNYEGSFGPGLGPVWVAISARFSDDRGSFGLHLDDNIDWAPGSAGCIVFPNKNELKRLVECLRKFDPSTLVVNWGL